MASLNLPQPKPEYRAFEIIAELTPGLAIFPVRDTRNVPHLRPGEFAVVDLNDKTFVSGEVYLVQYKPHPSMPWRATRYAVWQLKAREYNGMNGNAMGIWFHPLDNPKSAEDAERRLKNGTIHLSDGPLNPTYLSEYIAGRVIGLWQGDSECPLVPAKLETADAQS